MTWRTLSFILVALLLVQTWRACTRTSSTTPAQTSECAPESKMSISRTHVASRDDSSRTKSTDQSADAEEPPPSSGMSFNGFKLPAWTLWLAPQPGESMLSYRDRMVPLAQAAVAPHRARVARGRDDFAAKVNLDSQQRAQLDAAVQEAQGTIQDTMMSSLLGGQLTPKTFKPMTGVALARDVLDAIDKANARFMASLREDQKTALGQHPFDFADYLLFSARWEDALGVTH